MPTFIPVMNESYKHISTLNKHMHVRVWISCTVCLGLWPKMKQRSWWRRVVMFYDCDTGWTVAHATVCVSVGRWSDFVEWVACCKLGVGALFKFLSS
ncbi:hypothetical protein J6590_105486, partial [Homalodisca vitripennis]